MSKKTEALSGGFALPTPARTHVPDDVADSFVSKSKSPPAAKSPKKPRKATSSAKKTQTLSEPGSNSRLRRAESGERIAVYLPPALAEKLRVRCATDRRSLSDALTEALTQWL